MAASPDARLAFLVDVVKLLIGPITFIVVGMGVFVYEAGWGHSEAFATLGIAVALTGAGLGADFIQKRISS